MTRTYAIADVRGRFDLLVRAMEVISSHAREHGTGSLPEHKIVILGNIERGPDSEQIVEYLTQERLRS
jgi:serine/threonine protein phosphatase 1